MVEVTSLSVVETNKLRESIGLPPLSTPDNDQNEGKTQRRKVSDTPVQQGTAKEELSLEETNKLRLSLGLKPIPVGPDDGLAREKKEAENFNKHLSEARERDNDAHLMERINRSKTQSKTRKRLASGKTLLDEDIPDSTDDWLNKLGQPETKTAKKQRIRPNIVSAELDGLKIGHNSKEISSLGDDAILTLKDTNILGDGDDELTNESLTNIAKVKKNLADKLEADGYSNTGKRLRGFSAEDDEDGGDDYLTITDSTIKLTEQNKENGTKTDETSKQQVQISNLFSDNDDSDIESHQPSDYAKRKKRVRMKKILKKSSLNSRKRADATLDNKEEEDDISVHAVQLEKAHPSELIADDIELSDVLSRTRKLKQKKRTHMTPEDIAREMNLIKRWEAENRIEEASIAAHGARDAGIVFDDTSDFLSSLNRNILAEKHEEKKDIKTERPNTDPGVKIEDTDEVSLKDEHLAGSNPITSVKKEDESSNPRTTDEQDTSPSFNGGLAATLKFLQSRQILHEETNEEREHSKQQREAVKHAELLKLKISIESRLLREELESDRAFMNLPKEEREQIFDSHLDNILKEKSLIPDTTDNRKNNKYKNNKYSNPENLDQYNPQVKLSYRDESGNELNTKEAFKYLSHKFHGIGPGKATVDKKLKKLQQERDKKSANTEGVI